MAKKKKKSYKTYEEGSLMDAYVKQVQKHGASSLLMPDEKTHRYLKRLGFFSPEGTLPKKKEDYHRITNKSQFIFYRGLIQRRA